MWVSGDRTGSMTLESGSPQDRGDQAAIDVLVVEARSDLRAHVVEVLTSFGYRVGDVADAPGALEQIRSRAIGALVVVRPLPALGAFDLLEQLGRIGAPPIVLLRAIPGEPVLTHTHPVTTGFRPWVEPTILMLLVAAALEAGGSQRTLDVPGAEAAPQRVDAPAN